MALGELLILQATAGKQLSLLSFVFRADQLAAGGDLPDQAVLVSAERDPDRAVDVQFA